MLQDVFCLYSFCYIGSFVLIHLFLWYKSMTISFFVVTLT